MQQARDFEEESHLLAELLAPLPESGFSRVTQFKDWTINDVLGHLHMFNVAAGLTLESEEDFAAFFAPIASGLARGQNLLATQAGFLDGLSGRALLDVWRKGATNTARSYATADPKKRVKWAGPEMSARSSITARQMETWAHGQEVFDLLGVKRQETDRIRNIVHLGVSTYGWSFVNKGLDVPGPAPYVELTAPSGQTWGWNDAQADNSVTGSAVDFARVVCQTRAVADTALVTTPGPATRWMEIAQCFAGPPETPPPTGARHRVA